MGGESKRDGGCGETTTRLDGRATTDGTGGEGKKEGRRRQRTKSRMFALLLFLSVTLTLLLLCTVIETMYSWLWRVGSDPSALRQEPSHVVRAIEVEVRMDRRRICGVDHEHAHRRDQRRCCT